TVVNVLAKDTEWTGPVSLRTSVEVSFQGALANKPINTLVANYFDATGNNTLNGTNPTVTARTTTAGVAGANGLSAVQNIAFTGTVKTAGIKPSYFTLTYDDGINPPVT